VATAVSIWPVPSRPERQAQSEQASWGIGADHRRIAGLIIGIGIGIGKAARKQIDRWAHGYR
jgi:hypothetical protein